MAYEPLLLTFYFYPTERDKMSGMTVGELKIRLSNIDDEHQVIFETQKNNAPADTSFSIDVVEERFDSFFVLISKD
jgi:hypothetical protein